MTRIKRQARAMAIRLGLWERRRTAGIFQANDNHYFRLLCEDPGGIEVLYCQCGCDALVYVEPEEPPPAARAA
jgi:hypothetical protein